MDLTRVAIAAGALALSALVFLALREGLYGGASRDRLIATSVE